MAIQLRDRKSMSSGSTRNVMIDLSEDLQAGDTLVDPPTVTTTTGMSITNKHINNVQLFDKVHNRYVEAGTAVTFTVASSTPGSYTISFQATTSASPAENLAYELVLTVV